ncbi:MAG TPA: methyltransferase domain-containing protein [Chitinophagaceae bacterium]|nr:methyltransferase domain-containing protein [Chitinophagaceae bacterium]
MAQKHYNAAYLEDTATFLQGLKTYSYTPFLQTKNGTVIDLGCGTGIDVLKLSHTLGNAVQVVGIDHDAALLEKGKLAAEEGQNVDFICSEATRIPYDTDSIEGLRAERLIQHLVQPDETIKEAKRVLKQGKPLVLVETDWASLVFYHGEVAVQQKLIHYLTEVKINNGYAARKLTHYLEEAGLQGIKTEIFPFTLKSLKEANDYLWIELILGEMKEKQYLSEQEHEQFLFSLKKADQNQYFACSINIVVVSSIK